MTAFNATLLSPYATSIVDIDYYTNFITRYGGAFPFTITLNSDGDYITTLSGVERIVASSRNAVHGGTEGDWYYQDYNENTWVAASVNNSITAIAEGKVVIIGLLLNKSSTLIDGITEICGVLVSPRSKEKSGLLTFISGTNTITASTSLNIFDFVSEFTEELIITGMVETSNNASHEIVSYDLSVDPQEVVVSSILIDEVGSGNVKYGYEQALSFPRSGLSRANRTYSNIVIPKQIKDAVCLLAGQFAKGDFFQSSQDKEGLKKISIGGGQVLAEFTYESEYLLFKDYKKYLNNEVLQMLEPFLCEAIREFGETKIDNLICSRNSLTRYF